MPAHNIIASDSTCLKRGEKMSKKTEPKKKDVLKAKTSKKCGCGCGKCETGTELGYSCCGSRSKSCTRTCSGR